MATACKLAAALLVVLSLGIPPASAQFENTPFLYDFEFGGAPDGTTEVLIGQVAQVKLTFEDRSRDSATPIIGSGGSVYRHRIEFDAKAENNESEGWVPQSIAPFQTMGGDTRDVIVRVAVDPSATNPFLKLNVTATAHTEGGDFQYSIHLLFFSPGIVGFNVRSAGSFDIGPRDVADAGIIIRNGGLLPRTFQAEVASNPCNLQIGAPPSVVVQPHENKLVPFTIQGPEDRFLYLSQECSMSIAVFAVDNPQVRLTASVGVVVNGGYIDPQWVIWLVEILIVLFLIIFLLLRRKERIEEEILGKPQKPWTIPVEVVYLKALKQKDERAWYVVRHHLMEEEYRSSLLWYKAYKHATKGSRKKEGLVLRQEKAYKRWVKQWKREIAKPIKQADRFDAKLQAKLDRKARKLHRKQTRKVRKLVAKMQKAHGAQVERALAKWEKDSKRAAKKGLALPKRPVVPEPDYPDEPEATPIALAEHKWAKRSARFRARMLRKQGDLEVKFEKADARRLRKVRRKVQRIARKLDDPQFVEEHPLLAGDKPAAAKASTAKSH